MSSPERLDLCVICKTSRHLCGKQPCPLLSKWYGSVNIPKPLITRLDETFAPPAFFVGYSGYPKVNAGPMLTPERLGSEVIDYSERWHTKTQDDIVKMRLSLLRTKSLVSVKKPLDNKIIETSHEMLLGIKPVDVEVELDKKIRPRIYLNERSPPHGPSSTIKKLDITENQTPLTGVEKAYYDTDLNASRAVKILGTGKIDINTITRVFSAGMLGEEKNRRLVPTRWSITAVDDILSKQKIKQIKNFQILGEYRVFTFYLFGNRFVIVLIPDVWQYEMIEVWFQGAYLNVSDKNIGVSDYEGYKGRTTYADKITGAYYAARLATTEYLIKEQRQAQVLVLREIDDSYKFPLGVWVIRQGVRQAMNNEYKKGDTIDNALNQAVKVLRLPKKYWKNKSKIYKMIKEQPKLDFFFSTLRK